MRKVYENADILVSSSSYETLPGTLVEAQAYGCVPVSFNQGGQSDIVDHKVTGYIAEYSDDPVEGGRRLAEGIEWAVDAISEKAAALTGKALTHTGQASARSGKEGAISGKEELLRAMRENVERRFSARSVAQAYLRLIAEK